jgi:NAD(P)H-hydrate epimerase
MKILTAAQMQEIDRLTTERCGVPSLTLMENAGFHLYLALVDMLEELEEVRIAIVCGKGNNGGDGFVLARQLFQRGILPDVFLLARQGDVSGDAAVNLRALTKSRYPVIEVDSAAAWKKVVPSLVSYDVIVDAILGTGISQPLRGLYSRVVGDINESDVAVLSVDIPSGMFSDSLESADQTIWAERTVTFTAPKPAQILSADQDTVGELHIVPIGTPSWLLDKPQYYMNLLTPQRMADSLFPRALDSHKGTYGHVAMIAASRGKSGAAGLGSIAALRSGSGLVTSFVPETVQPTVASYDTEIMTEGFPATDAGSFSRQAVQSVLELLKTKDAAGIGPGLTTHPETVEFVRSLLRSAPVPLVVDADALNAFQGSAEALTNENEQPLILTPHPGEFSRLIGIQTKEILKNQVKISREFTEKHSVWLVLKTFRTLIVTPTGEVFVSPLGNPGMATAGMGDVLTGVLTSMVGQFSAQQRTEPGEVTQALCLGVYLHGLAGDIAAEAAGWESLLAGDVIDCLADAFQLLEEE